MVLARPGARARRLRGARPRPVAGRFLRAGARRRALDSRGARVPRRHRRAENLRRGRAACVRAAAARHALRSGSPLLPDHRDRGGAQAPAHRNDRARGSSPRQARVYRLSAEHSRQDAGDGLQRAGE